MIVQACINGARPFDYHPALPLTVEAMARDSAACVAAGAAEIHLHPRAADGQESLAAVDETIRLVRRACPGTLVGVSTGAWIEGDQRRTRDYIAAWRVLPDYASVNLSEADAPAVIDLLHGIGVGVEAGLASVEDARRLVALADCQRVFRILIEIDEQELSTAGRIADGIAAVLAEAGLARPILLHGFDATVWHFVDLARQRRWSTRVGLEDGCHRAQGDVARNNAQLVTDAVRMMRQYAS
ncbi:3-keto-5-aminohexanoate cleavage protein [Pleomorphomonas carboxyditropha]|uniref:3-keto-5-aminohexanoate cleavage enzyme n=1 Tax=Pleomorphomonas carboxyditropha TaxID=2023338 RepID=A0A2G9X0L0_9HYPH|nr:3-keto-5-aminohexanoate cleavage protein [Pleomorphomonas carboxyditropha]PIP00465.1 3-keto-5-aminohexanoate cleavage enzyme [Pleomorphomonas carboxyditropha]